jgi:peptidoglycan/xylan/chitin deacetylase (PgdA/CDA1 family)
MKGLPSSRNLSASLLAIGLLCSTVPLGAATSPLVRGAQLLTQARPRAALAEFTAAVSEDDSCPQAHCGVGAARLHLGQTAEALEAFNRALDLDKTSRPARLGIASAFFHQREYQKALSQYRYCLAFDCAERAPVRAAAACAACLLGLYEVAESEATLALKEDPSCQLARTVAGAAWIARGDPNRALGILQEDGPARTHETLPPRFALLAPSPLFSPDAHYFASRDLSDEARLAFLGSAAATGYPEPGGTAVDEPGPTSPHPTPPETESQGFRITRPRPGQLVSGDQPVVVEIPPDLFVDYVVLLVDDEFRSVTNSQPFRLSVDTTTLADGPHQIRVDAHGRTGRVVASAAALVVVRRGRERALPYEEQMARAAVGHQLERLLVVRASAGSRWQLIGHALRETGGLDEAVAAFEEAFCRQPTASGIRADLLTAYRDTGLRVGTDSREVHYVPGRQQVILTFDDGPHPLVTPRILSVLDRYGVKATFFLVGKQVELYPALAADIVECGHEVGSHSYSHSNLGRLPKVYVERELVKSRAAIRQATGQTVTLFRPPGGHYNRSVRDAAAETGFTTVFWTSNIGNCAGWEPSATVTKFMAELGDGGIVLLHNGEDGSLEVLPGLLAALGNQRRPVGTVSAIVNHAPYDGPALGP